MKNYQKPEVEVHSFASEAITSIAGGTGGVISGGNTEDEE